MESISLFKVLAGSRLYGTNTPKSDFDYKCVVLPNLSGLLLGEKIVTKKEKPIGVSDSEKMPEGETETEYVPIQTFLDDFFNGQTYALEMVFAVSQGNFQKCNSFDPTYMCNQLIEKFLTKNVKKMVGYAVGQSRIYGLKTERYTSLKQAHTALENTFKIMVNNKRSQESFIKYPELVEQLCTIPHVQQVMIENAKGGSELAPALDICGKKYPLTNKIMTVLNSVNNTLETYGNRVQQYEGEGVDWKALSHAIRITEQVLELCDTGKLVFPRPNAEYLLAVKKGQLSIEEAVDYLNVQFNKIEDSVNNSKLVDKTPEMYEDFRNFKIDYLNDFYLGPIIF